MLLLAFNIYYSSNYSSIIHNKFPKIPMAFIQIGLGVCLYILSIPLHFEFEPEVL